MDNATEYVIGYLAFLPDPANGNVEQSKDHNFQIVEHGFNKRIHEREESHQRRINQAIEEARKGEIEWVKSGGILRDETGKRDYARTNRVRSELELEQRQRTTEDNRKAYEDRWAVSFSSDPLRFSDIPWPVEILCPRLEDLTSHSISQFVLNFLHVRDPDVITRTSIRQLMLRFHPDKTVALFSRLVDEDIADVKEGARVVFSVLKKLQEQDEFGK
jgi:hypothetical protein